MGFFSKNRIKIYFQNLSLELGIFGISLAKKNLEPNLNFLGSYRVAWPKRPSPIKVANQLHLVAFVAPQELGSVSSFAGRCWTSCCIPPSWYWPGKSKKANSRNFSTGGIFVLITRLSSQKTGGNIFLACKKKDHKGFYNGFPIIVVKVARGKKKAVNIWLMTIFLGLE